MADQLTPEETAKILTWAGVWKAGERCWTYQSSYPLRNHLCVTCGGQLYQHNKIGNVIPMPALEGDFADVVAMKCSLKIGPLLKAKKRALAAVANPEEWYRWHDIESRMVFDLLNGNRQAIFAAVLAYLEQEVG